MAFKNFWVQFKVGKELQQVNIEAESFVIGRAPECDLTINTDVVSRRHLKVYLEDGQIFLKDLGSTNGTFLDDEKLKPHEKYQYNTGDKLHIESANECSIRITAIYEKGDVDAELDVERVELEKRKLNIKLKNESFKNELNKENYVKAATESVDSIFENILFVTKNARFNKEKKIKEAEYQSQEMLDNALREIDERRASLEQEILSLQVETKIEAKRILSTANTKAEMIIEQAQEQARQLTLESQDLAERTKQEVEHLKESTKIEMETQRLQAREEVEEYKRVSIEEAEKYRVKAKIETDKTTQETILTAQEKHSEIIAEAYTKNTTFKEENSKLGQEIAQYRLDSMSLKKDVEKLTADKQEHEQLLCEVKEKYDTELSNYNTFKIQVINLENRNQEAKKVLDQEIPILEEQLNELKGFITKTEVVKKRESEDLDRLKADILLKQDQITKTEDKHQKAEQRLDQLNTTINEAENNLFKLNALKQQRNEELDKEIADRKLKQKLSEDEANQKLEQSRSKTEKEIAVNLQNAKEQAIKMVTDSRNESEQIRADANKYKKSIEKETISLKKEAEAYVVELRAKEHAEQEKRQKSFNAEIDAEKELRLVEANRQASGIIERAKHQSTQMLDKAKGEAAKMKNACEIQSTNLMDSVRKQCANLLDAAKKECENLLTTTQSETESIRVSAEQYAKDLMDKADRESSEHLSESEMRAAQIMNQSQTKATQQIQSLEQELERRKKESDDEIQMIRTNTVRHLDEQRKVIEIEEQQRNNIRVLRLKKDLNDVLRARIKPYLRQDDHLEKVAAIIEKSINAILLDEVDNQFVETENYSNIDPSLQQKKVKNFWIYSGASVIGLIIFIILLPKFKNVAMESGRKIASNMEKQQMQKIADKKKENDLSKIFTPDKTQDYQSTYTERVLYTESYVEIELSKGYREKWILELQDYFVHKLRLDENTLVPFIASEANLVHDLNEEMKKINGNFVDLGVSRMRDIEIAFDKKIRRNITKESDYKKIMKFKEKFFLDNRDRFAPPPQKTPASLSTEGEEL